MKTNIYIFGAHSRAQTLAEYLQCLHPEITVEAYLYDNNEENLPCIGGIKSICLDKPPALHTDYPVYIGTRGIYHQQIATRLKQLGFLQIYPVTVELDLQLRNEYIKKRFAGIGKPFIKIDKLKLSDISEKDPSNENQPEVNPAKADSLEKTVSATIYVAISGHDKPLQHPYPLAPYEKEILAGAALTEAPLPPNVIADNAGDNISRRNRQFSELTALYWLWKHAKEQIIGLAHYRRRFILPEDWLRRMQDNDVDVILPVPLYVAPNLAENYKSRHDPSDWDYMMECLKKRDMQEYKEAEEFFSDGLYSPCNMFIMRRDTLNELCEWLFPILFAVAGHGGEKEDGYLNRYPGFISERLITLFFEKSRNKHKVIYSDKNFLE